MGAAERREREKLELRQKILDAGRAILATDGYAALTMRKLAADIEYTPGALYAHFPDKAALVRAICEHDMRAFAGRFMEAMTIDEPIERLRRLAKLYARFALEHPQQYKVLFVLDVSEELKRGLVERGDPTIDAYAVLELAVRHAIARGHFASWKGRDQLLAQLLWAAMHGVVSIEIRRTGDMHIPFEPIEDRVDTICEVMLAGLAHTAPIAPSKAKPANKKNRPG